jgi:low temperature requirement protein LtrA
MTDNLAPRRVSTIELFLDLVFVFAVTQLTTLLADRPNPVGLLQALLIFGVVWWMYGGYVWLTNAVAPDTEPRRLFLLLAMLGFLLIALAIPTTFDGGGVVFGAGYVLVVLVHSAMFRQSEYAPSLRAMLRISSLNFLSASIILAAGVVGGTAMYPLFAIALLIQVVTPFIARANLFSIDTGHFVERYGLLVLIVLGESIVAIGVGLAGSAPDLPLVTAAVLALAVTSMLWWIYFSGDDVRAEEAMERASLVRRFRIAINAFFYATIPMLLGVVAFAAGVKFATGHPFEPIELPAALLLAGGIALYLVGDAIFRVFIEAGVAWNRLFAAVAALATIPIGTAISAVAQLAAIWLLLAISVFAPVTAERRREARALLD